MKMKPNLVFYSGATLLEGPVWNKNLQSILFVSIEQCMVYLLNVKSGVIRSYKTKGQVGFAAFEDDENIIVAAYEGVFRIRLSDGRQKFLTQLKEKETIRYNDGILDAKGRILAGTTGYNCYAPGENCLYSWDGVNKKKIIEGTSISNGIGFSLDGKYMYFVDTPTGNVSRYQYNMETGEVQFDKDIIYIEEGLPDGICIDKDDTLWVAHWGGYKVSHWNPYTGEKLGEIVIPCKNVTSCCIGGRKMEYLFVTTAKRDDGSVSEGLAGGLFAVKIR